MSDDDARSVFRNRQKDTIPNVAGTSSASVEASAASSSSSASRAAQLTIQAVGGEVRGSAADLLVFSRPQDVNRLRPDVSLCMQLVGGSVLGTGDISHSTVSLVQLKDTDVMEILDLHQEAAVRSSVATSRSATFGSVLASGSAESVVGDPTVPIVSVQVGEDRGSASIQQQGIF